MIDNPKKKKKILKEISLSFFPEEKCNYNTSTHKFSFLQIL